MRKQIVLALAVVTLGIAAFPRTGAATAVATYRDGGCNASFDPLDEEVCDATDILILACFGQCGCVGLGASCDEWENGDQFISCNCWAQ
jgi:hypothetical protein